MFDAILLPIDLGNAAEPDEAFQVSVNLARSYGATIHALTVLPDFGLSIVGSYFKKGFERDALHEAGDRLVEFLDAHRPEDVLIRPHIAHGTIYDEILAAADKLVCDLIVMASHRPELKDYLLGPNAARVVRHAKQSVFVVRN